MPVTDEPAFQNWIQAFDHHKLIESRYDAAAKLNNKPLMDYLRPELDKAIISLNAAVRDLKSLK